MIQSRQAFEEAVRRDFLEAMNLIRRAIMAGKLPAWLLEANAPAIQPLLRAAREVIDGRS